MRIADVHYYFYLRFGNDLHPLALVSLFSLPDPIVFQQSSGTVYLSECLNDTEGLCVVPLKSIKAVVAMFPNTQVTFDGKLVSTGKFSLMRHPYIQLAEQTDALLDESENDSELYNDSTT